jgi:hypothetical protein
MLQKNHRMHASFFEQGAVQQPILAMNMIVMVKWKIIRWRLNKWNDLNT